MGMALRVASTVPVRSRATKKHLRKPNLKQYCLYWRVYLPILAKLLLLADISADSCNFVWIGRYKCLSLQKKIIMEIIRRQAYLDHIIFVMNKNMMLVLVGQRRVGKSYI